MGTARICSHDGDPSPAPSWGCSQSWKIPNRWLKGLLGKQLNNLGPADPWGEKSVERRPLGEGLCTCQAPEGTSPYSATVSCRSGTWRGRRNPSHRSTWVKKCGLVHQPVRLPRPVQGESASAVTQALSLRQPGH